MMILKLHGVVFHAIVVIGPEHDHLFKSAATYMLCSVTKGIECKDYAFKWLLFSSTNVL